SPFSGIQYRLRQQQENDNHNTSIHVCKIRKS
ncbi:MAG: hypothetical protein RL059_1115, partial [Bacteroidota bacterium]